MLLFRLWVPALGMLGIMEAPSSSMVVTLLEPERVRTGVLGSQVLGFHLSVGQLDIPGAATKCVKPIQITKLKGQPSEAYNAVVGRLGQHQPWFGCLKSSHPQFAKSNLRAILGRSCPT